LHIRGEVNNLGESVPRGFLQVCGTGDARLRPDSVDAIQNSGRLALANWLTDPDHPLTARVAANRIWMRLMGEGIVRTVGNFGTRGQRPTHPELLDALAIELVRRGWSRKHLIRQIAADSIEFKSAMPAKAEEARTQMSTLLQLTSEKERLASVFGAAHPKVQELQSQILITKQFLQDQQAYSNPETPFGDSVLTPEALLKAYVGFLQHDLSALAQRRKELIFLAGDAEKKAKELIEYELTDMVLQKKISRQEALFDGIVTQLRELDTASGLSGYLYEFLEVPR
ncbi:unnamed protein product, partial [Hapterophycus canaliculatus]